MATFGPLNSDSQVREKNRAPRNRTLTATPAEVERLRTKLLRPNQLTRNNFVGGSILGDCFAVFGKLPEQVIDLLILDPPYNLSKRFGDNTFSRVSTDEYTNWLRRLFQAVKPLLKPSATVYICGEWLSSVSIFTAAAEFFKVRNRITWEREKGRGALTNWKNSSEDIWFCTMSDDYIFNVEDVKLRRRVIAPYRETGGKPKDWLETENGNFRDTHPSNLWTDITVPFWSMPENTDHPTQKSEKFIAKLILASSNPGDIVFDPFLGSGTSSVVAKKLRRAFCGVEIEEPFALLAEKRLEIADADDTIQGYQDRVFWERNTLNSMTTPKKERSVERGGMLLAFDELS